MRGLLKQNTAERKQRQFAQQGKPNIPVCALTHTWTKQQPDERGEKGRYQFAPGSALAPNSLGFLGPAKLSVAFLCSDRPQVPPTISALTAREHSRLKPVPIVE